MIYRALYETNGVDTYKDFLSQRDMYKWISETARNDDTFRYFGSKTIQTSLGRNRNMNKKETYGKMSAFERWIRTFIEEKDLPVIQWEIEHNGFTHFIDNYDMIEIICEMPAENQRKIKEKLIQLDFINGDINHFLEYLAKGYIETYY